MPEIKTPPVTTQVGTLAILVGAVWLFFERDAPSVDSDVFIAGTLVIGGLLLRIEGAISRRDH